MYQLATGKELDFLLQRKSSFQEFIGIVKPLIGLCSQITHDLSYILNADCAEQTSCCGKNIHISWTVVFMVRFVDAAPVGVDCDRVMFLVGLLVTSKG